MKLRSKITSKYQITIPKEVRESLKLSMEDVIEWSIDEQGIRIEPANKPFLKYKGFLTEGAADIKSDIQKAWKTRAERYSK
ncbi:AbrB/MazE/SpoVT family DNA-binding domain-containing protein [Leptospira alstonii]|uniref:Transcriptional regulator, AbrB family n=2 Tax=Leptospira alstonii TaxID=28452 RepID=M6D7X6_9LEPT|nr:AbrB/MazE/SpoVT family DNA-binding domain-containing protein [Leptospira alstonii]EMJ94660.1 transcriptional regulator, AbrB family [Leptospira alstonii serovar Sichuan str. 79601]EQA81278.1 transcriptional regulator, AbrB family [Leptospira alstonii serovar Pingchang str. 80-412]